ncbi:hypothetical protein J7337_005843 [Fusarium musae]|uniref:DNA2/NAM7 helicase helicase domain-containing protein n=1 Tax=Fusarium musae TaxID=1042133 RepID=A0A9P8DJH0_9HYPO|nr:hypothetical protein J7337_005843 [Fusarium musae]KAG9503006.1 hypothetical protein J7337_005843 [Fusarium musae]
MSRSPFEGHCDPGGSAPPKHPVRSHLNPAATSFQPRSSTSQYFPSGQASYNPAAWSSSARGMSSASEHYSAHDSNPESTHPNLASHSTHDSANPESTHPNLASHSTHDSDDLESPCLSLASHSTHDSANPESTHPNLASYSTHDSADAESTHPNLASHSAMSDTDESRVDKHNRMIEWVMDKLSAPKSQIVAGIELPPLKISRRRSFAYGNNAERPSEVFGCDENSAPRAESVSGQIEDPMEAVFREITDRTGAAANLKGEPSKDKQGELVFKMGRYSTNFFHSIVTIGDKPLPGFDAATIARLGIGPFPGLHCRTRMSAGQFGRPILHIELCIRHLCNVDKFMDIIVPLDRVLDDVTLVDVESADDTALSPLYAFEAFDMEGLARQPGHDGYADYLVDADLTQPAAAIQIITPNVRLVRVDLNKCDVFTVNNVRFHKDWDRHPTTTIAIAKAVREMFKDTESLFSIGLWFLPEQSFERHWPDILNNVRQLANPFAQYLAKCRNLNYKDLGFANIAEIDEEELPDKPVPKTNLFIDNEHRTVTLVAGAREELAMQDKRTNDLYDLHLPVVFIKDTFSRWLPESDDMEKYGMAATGCVTRFFMVMSVDPDIAGALPDIGDSCTMALNAPFGNHPLPTTELTANERNAITRSILKDFHLGEHTARNVRDNVTNEINAAGEDNGRIDYLQENVDDMADNAFLKRAARTLFIVRKEASDEAKAAYPDVPDSQRIATAVRDARQLRRDNYEDDEEWYQAIDRWVNTHARHGMLRKSSPNGPEYRARCIPLPYGTEANVKLFEVHVPRQENWIPGLARPYIRVDIPTVDPVGPINKFLESLFTPGYKDTETEMIVRAVPKVKKSLLAKIFFAQEEKTTKLECDTPFRLNGRAEVSSPSIAGQFWSFTTSFQGKPVVYSFLRAFPGLASALEGGKFTAEAREFVNALSVVPFGYAFLSGGPGSGKTTLALSVVKEALSDTANIARAIVKDAFTDETANFSSEGTASTSKTNAINATDKWGTTSTGEITTANETITSNGFTWNADAQLVADTQPADFLTSNPEDNEEVWDEVPGHSTTNSTDLKVPDVFQVDTPVKDVTTQASTKTRIAWTAGHNKLVDDAVSRAIEQIPDKLVVRVQPWALEMGNLKRVRDDIEPKQTDTSVNAAANRSMVALVKHTNAFSQRVFKEKSPTQVKCSLSEYARSKAIEDPKKWSDVHDAWNELLNDPDRYALNKPKHEEAFQGLMSAAIDDVDMVCGTPVALAELAAHVKWTPHLIVVDEAARLNETTSLMLQSF